MKNLQMGSAVDTYQRLKEEARGGGSLLQTVQCPVSTNYHSGAGICQGGTVSHALSLTIVRI